MSQFLGTNVSAKGEFLVVDDKSFLKESKKGDVVGQLLPSSKPGMLVLMPLAPRDLQKSKDSATIDFTNVRGYLTNDQIQRLDGKTVGNLIITDEFFLGV